MAEHPTLLKFAAALLAIGTIAALVAGAIILIGVAQTFLLPMLIAGKIAVLGLSR